MNICCPFDHDDGEDWVDNLNHDDDDDDISPLGFSLSFVVQGHVKPDPRFVG